MALNTYVILERQKEEIFPLVNFEIKILLKKVKARLSPRLTIHHPWEVYIKHDIHHSIFYAWFRAVRDYCTEFGRNIQTTPTEHIIEFTDIRSLKLHLSKGLDNSIDGADS